MKRTWLWILAAGLWCLVIYQFSASPQWTASRTGAVLSNLAARLPPAEIQQLHHVVRKAAHVTIFATLALLLRRTVRQNADAYRWAWWMCTGWAFVDEFRQAFAPGRTSNPKDVLLDSVAAATALCVVWCCKRWRGTHQEAKQVS